MYAARRKQEPRSLGQHDLARAVHVVRDDRPAGQKRLRQYARQALAQATVHNDVHGVKEFRQAVGGNEPREMKVFLEAQCSGLLRQLFAQYAVPDKEESRVRMARTVDAAQPRCGPTFVWSFRTNGFG